MKILEHFLTLHIFSLSTITIKPDLFLNIVIIYIIIAALFVMICQEIFLKKDLTLNSTTLWQIILKEFTAQSNVHLCNSATFKTIWENNTNKHQIIKWTKIFLSKNLQYNNWKIPDNLQCLFTVENSMDYFISDFYNIRKEFIVWLINYLDNKFKRYLLIISLTPLLIFILLFSFIMYVF